MSSVNELRKRLQRLKEEREKKRESDSDNSRENTTETVTDYKSWLSKIQEDGDKPEDWLHFTEIMQGIGYSSNTMRFSCLSNYYNKAMKSIPAEATRKNQSYAKLLVNCANLKSMFDVDDARQVFSAARVSSRYFAFVHVAAAQLELSQGEKNKAIRILEKAKELGATPPEMISMALKNLLCGHQELMSEAEMNMFQDQEKENVIDSENLTSHSRSHKVHVADKDQAEQDSSPSLSLTNTSINQNSLTGSSLTGSSLSSSLKISKNPTFMTKTSADVCSAPNVLRERNLSSSDDGGDTIPWQNMSQPVNIADTSRSSSVRPSQAAPVLDSGSSSERGRSLRHYNSTPDCKNHSLLSSSTRRKKFSGKPMRVLKRSSLPQLREGHQDDEHHEATGDMGLLPLPESGALDFQTPGDASSISRRPTEELPCISSLRFNSLLSGAGDTPEELSNTAEPEKEYDTVQSDSGIITESESMHGDKHVGDNPPLSPMEVSRCTQSMDISQATQPMDCSSTVQPLDSSQAGGTTLLSSTGGTSILSSKSSTLQNTAIENQSLTVPSTRDLLKPPQWEEASSGVSSESHQNGTDKSNCAQKSQQGAVSEKKPVPEKTSEKPRIEVHPPVTSKPPLPMAPCPQTVAAAPGVPTPNLPVPGLPTPMQNTPGGMPACPPGAPPQGMAPWPYQTPQGHPMMAPQMWTPMGKRNETFTINGKFHMVLRMVGRGGSSKVYETLDQDSKVRAVKCVNLDGADESTVNSYTNEISLLQRLQGSENIIKLYDYEYQEEDSLLYIVMEKGDTDLATYFKTRRKRRGVGNHELKFYWEEMLRSVHVLHNEGIVHADLKPANFLLVEGNLKLIDFGIAKSIQHDMTSVTRDQQVGTLNYMSPEAILDTHGGTEVDEHGRLKPRIKIGVKSDVWSLGCILYTLVYNRAPFHKISNQILKLQAITNPKYEIEFPPTDDPSLQDVLRRCLVRDPKMRASIDELLQHSYLSP